MTQTSDLWTTIAAIAAITLIVCVATLSGMNHTLVKLGIATIAGIAGFSLRGLLRRQP
jgi:hypothetical protein